MAVYSSLTYATLIQEVAGLFSKVAETCAHLGEGSLIWFCCQINERVPRKNATNFLSLPKFLPITAAN